jgi:cyclic pyranopterin monophosphate synthase
VSERHPEAEAKMVDVTGKDVTSREAIAACRVRMSKGTRDLLLSRGLPKGDALEVARVAGIMGAKRTADLIPLCHPISIGAVQIDFGATSEGFDVSATVRTSDRTGVEMEALTAVTVAALTIYDMVKGTERGVEVTDVRLISKSGGRSGNWRR